MTIEPDKIYVLLHTQISFARNIVFLRKIKELFTLEIPYIDFPKLTPELQDALDQYIYVLNVPGVEITIHKLCHHYSSVSFTELGKVMGSEILGLIDSCLEELKSSVIIGGTYKILSGPLKNLHTIVRDVEGEYAHVSYETLNCSREITLPITNLEETVPLNPEAGFKDFLADAKKSGRHGAVIIDGSFSLHKSAFGYDTVYTRAGRFVGGCQGFYFDILRYKELYPDRQIHVVFDSYDEEKFKENPSYKAGRMKCTPKWIAAYKDNFNWCERLVRALGYHFYHMAGKEGDDIIASLASHLTVNMGYQNVLIYSADRDFYSIVDDKISVILPKKSFRGNSRTITEVLAREEFGVNENRKINWIRALSGDGSDNIGGVNSFNKRHKQETKYMASQFLPYVNEASTLSICKEKLLSDARFEGFVKSGQFESNLKLLTMKKDIFKPKEDLSKFKTDYDKQKFLDLLEEVGFYRELEAISRIERILQSSW